MKITESVPETKRQKIYRENKARGNREAYDTTAQCMVNRHDICTEMDLDMIGKCICECHKK